MKSSIRGNALFKITSVIVAGIFLWNQIAWAGELPQVPPAMDEASGSMTPADLASSQSAAESLIETLNAIENDASDNKSIPPVCLYYDSGRVHIIKAPDGTKYEYSDEDWNGNDHGKLIKETAPEGTYKVYEDYYSCNGAGVDGWKRKYEATYEDEPYVVNSGNHAVKVTPTQTISDLREDLADYEDYAGKTLTLSCWVYSSNADSALLEIRDGAGGRYTRSMSHSGSGGWELLTVTHTVSSAPSYLRVRLIPDQNDGDDSAWFDDVMLVEGSSAGEKGMRNLLFNGDFEHWNQPARDQARYIKEYAADKTPLAMYEYYSDGTLHSKVDSSGMVYMHYDSGRIHIIEGADGTRYEFTDEDWNYGGYGRLIKETDSDGTYKTFEDYYDFRGSGIDIWQARNRGAFEDENGIVKTGSHAVRVIPELSCSDLRQYIPDYESYAGKTLTLSCWVYSEAPGAAKIEIRDEEKVALSEAHSGSGKWELLSVTFTASINPEGLRIRLIPDEKDGKAPACFDDVILVEGVERGDKDSKNLLLNEGFEKWYTSGVYQPERAGKYNSQGVLLEEYRYYSDGLVANKRTYSPSGHLHRETLADGRIYEYSDEDTGGCRRGKLIKEILPDGTYKTFERYNEETYDRVWTAKNRGDAYNEVNITKSGFSSFKVTPALVSSDLRYEVSDYADYAGRTVTFSCWVYSTQADSAYIEIRDGAAVSRSTRHSGSGNWELLTVTHTVDEAPSYLRLRLVPDANDGNDSAYFDDAMFMDASSERCIFYDDFEERDISDWVQYVNVYSAGGALIRKYEYYLLTATLKSVDYFMPDGTRAMRQEYDEAGNLTVIYHYYENGQLKERCQSDGLAWTYDKTGKLTEYTEKSGDVLVVYDAEGKVLRIIKGSYIEKREYIRQEGVIIHTLAVYDDKVRAVEDGYYAGLDLISETMEADNAGGISVTYDNNITVRYVDDRVSSLSTEGGYVNFYGDDGIIAENDHLGALYTFEGNFLKRVVTRSGNIYDFEKEETLQGAVVSVAEALIDGLRYEFTDARLSAIYGEEGRTEITELILTDSGEVTSLKINSTGGEVLLGEGDPLFIKVSQVIRALSEELANIEFVYDSDLNVSSILTGKYCRIFLESGQISEMMTPGGSQILYEFIEEGGETVRLKVTEAGAVRTFDASGNLLTVDFPDESNTSLSYAGGEIQGIHTEEGIYRDITFDAEGNLADVRLFKPDGDEYFFSGGTLRSFTASDNIEYELDASGVVIGFTDRNTGESYDLERAIDPDDGVELVIFTSREEKTQYIFKEDILVAICDDSTLRVDYEYDSEGRTSRIEVSYGGQRNATYIYEYTDGQTIITDDLGNKRYFDEDNRPIKVETPYGETYIYSYEVDNDGQPITVVSYSRRNAPDGLIVHYIKGEIYQIDRPDGSQVDNIEFDREAGKLKKFSVHTAAGKTYSVMIDGELFHIELEDFTRLIFCDGKLIAFAGSQGIVPLYDEYTEDEDLPREHTSAVDELYSELGLARDLAVLAGEKDTADSEVYLSSFADALGRGASTSYQEMLLENISWHTGENPHAAGVNYIFRDTGLDRLRMGVVLDSSSSTNAEGEVYFDVTEDVPGLSWGMPINLTAIPIKMLINVPEEVTVSQGAPVGARIFVQDENGNIQYGTVISLREREKWYALELTPTFGAVPMARTDTGFDASKIVRIGINLTTEEGGATSFQAAVHLKFLEGGEPSDAEEIAGMPLWMDLRNIHEYLSVENGDYIRVPGVDYLSSEHYDYVFNQLDVGGMEEAEELPDFPVWIDQRELGGYLKESNIALFGEISFMEGLESLIDEVTSSMLPVDFVAVTIYDEDDKVSSISKPDGTTTYFNDAGQIDFITFYDGSVFIDYEYDSQGGLISATMPSARDELADTTEEMILEIRRYTTETLLVLAEQEGLLEEHFIKTQVNPQLEEFAKARAILESQRYRKEKHNTWGVIWYSEVEVAGVDEAIRSVNRQEAEFLEEVNEELARLGEEVNSKKEALLAEADRIIYEYRWQAEKMLLAIRREETIPLICCYYRSVLGRDAGEEEINDVFRRLDENGDFSGFFRSDIVDAGALIMSIKSDPNKTLLELLSDDMRTFVDLYVEGEEVDAYTEDHLMADLDAIIKEGTFYEFIIDCLGEENIDEELLDRRDDILLEVAHVQARRDIFNSEVERVRQEVEEFNSLKQELIDLVEGDPKDIYTYEGYWKDFLNQYYTATFPIFTFLYWEIAWGTYELNLYIRDGELYTSSPSGEAVKVEGVPPDKKIVFDCPGERRTITLKGGVDLAQTPLIELDTGAVTFDTFVDQRLEEFYQREKTEITWLNRYFLQECYKGIAKKERNTALFEAKTLREDLYARSEYETRMSFKESVIEAVVAFLEDYKNNPNVKDQIFAILGISAGEVIDVTDTFIQAACDWLKGQDLHFGRSAFESLKKMLDGKGAIGEDGEPVSLIEVAKKALLVDILTGTTIPVMGEAIEISMFAMSKVAGLYGVDTKNARLSYDDILQMDTPFMTLINGHHYVTVLSLTETEVTYWESNLGEAGGEITVSREDFEDNWQGNVVTDDSSIDAQKLLTDTEARKIKGAFLGLIFGTISFVIGAIATVVTVAIEVMVVVVTALVDLIWTIGAGLVEALVNVGSMLSFAGNAFMGALGLGGAGIGSSALGGFGLGTLMTGPAAMLVKVGVGYGVSVGLEAMGVDPVISGIVASAVTGGVDGLLSPGGGLNAAFQSAIQWSSFSVASVLGQQFDLDPVISSILSMSTAALVGAGVNPEVSFREAFASIATHVAGELAYYGVQVAGSAMGLDPEVSYLAGIGIRSSLQAGLGTFGQGGGSPGDWLKATIDELTKPTNLALAFNIVGDAIGLPPMINNMIITAVGGLVDGFNENPENRILGMFQGMLDNFWNASIRALSFGLYDPLEGGWNKDIQRDYVLMNLTRFVEVVIEDGIEAAIENHLSNIFRDEAIRIINQRGGIADFLTGNAEMVEENGVWLKKINVTDEDKLYLDPDTDNIIGRDYGTIGERGEYGVNPYTGGFGLIDGTIEETTENGRMLYHIRNSVIIDKVELFGQYGYFSIVASDPETGLPLDENGMPIGGIVEDFEGRPMFTYEYINDDLNIQLNFDHPTVDVNSITSLNLTNLTDAEKQKVVNYYTLANGINNRNIFGSPSYMIGFKEQLAYADPNANSVMIPLYNEFIGHVNGSDFDNLSTGWSGTQFVWDLRQHGYLDENNNITEAFFALEGDYTKLNLSPEFIAWQKEVYDIMWNKSSHILQDGLRWLMDVYGDIEEVTSDQITDLIKQKIQAEFGLDYAETIVGMCYSGSGDPYIQAINKQEYGGGYLDVESIVFVGTPLKDGRIIMNPNVKTVVVVNGEKDVFGNPFINMLPTPNTFTHSQWVENIYNFEIKGAEHGDYFYDPMNPSSNDAFKMAATKFIAKITALSRNKTEMTVFLNTQFAGGAITIDGNKYKVDVERIIYNE